MEERKFTSDAESWEIFIGGISPKEFVRGYKNAEEAVDDFLANYPFDDEPAPTWLRGSLLSYLDDRETD